MILQILTRLAKIVNKASQAQRRTGLIAAAGLLIAIFVSIPVQPASASASTTTEDPEPLIQAAKSPPDDTKIRERILGILSQIDGLTELEVAVTNGVVTLAGDVASDEKAARAKAIAIRLEGVVTVEDEISRVLDVQGNLRPILERSKAGLERWMKALPLVLLTIVVFAVIAFVGGWLARRTTLWQRLLPNPFLAQLASQAIRIAGFVLGLIIALNLLGATAVIGTLLGSAGVLGLAIGFAVRDTLENYISSILLSFRQPFRAQDHILVGDHEGIVMRLTSRATVLMTLDGNHLRIPNSTVFKSVILNYTTNPERRFEFDLGIDAADDPAVAIETSLDTMSELAFLLDEPSPNAFIVTVGDSNIVLRFHAWVNQQATDFKKARSLTIRAVKDVLEAEGFTLPEPIYRLRIDANAGLLSTHTDDVSAQTERRAEKKMADKRSDLEMDTTPDRDLEERISRERQSSDEDLLDGARPTE